MVISQPLVCGQNNAPMKSRGKVFSELIAEFQKQYTLSDEDMLKIQVRHLFGQPLWFQKNGIGVVSESIHVDSSALRNRILLADDRVWEGKSREEKEIVAVERNGTVHSLTSGDSANAGVILIVFSPEHVQIIDALKGNGGYYVRSKKVNPTSQPKHGEDQRANE